MLAVGALVPLSYGRLGKSWKHAQALKELAKSVGIDLYCRMHADMARTVVQDPAKTQPLEDFWLAHKLSTEEDLQKEAAESPSDGQAKRKMSQASPNGKTRTRNRAVSTASALAPPGQSLSPHHPALSLPVLLDTFGPLIFPLYKAALLRKRILLVGQAPVELACNFGK